MLMEHVLALHLGVEGDAGAGVVEDGLHGVRGRDDLVDQAHDLVEGGFGEFQNQDDEFHPVLYL